MDEFIGIGLLSILLLTLAFIVDRKFGHGTLFRFPNNNIHQYNNKKIL